MEQLIKKESQKHLANQMREARLQRQIQVRQQAMAWTEATRKRFEEAKEQQVKSLANSVTGQVQDAAIKRIEELTKQHDLAMAQIGMAHRAAAGFQNVERLKSLKRLKNDEIAKNRGSTAMMRHIKQREAEKSKSMAAIKRKEEVRKAEDKVSKELISRRPLSVTNVNVESNVKLRPPEYHQSLAKTLKVASGSVKDKSGKLPPGVPVKSKTSKVGFVEKGRVPTSSSSELVLGSKSKPVKTGVFEEMVRIKASSPSQAGIDFANREEEFSKVGNLYGVGYKMRDKYMTATRGTPAHVPAPVQSMVRYFDASVPKGEVKYVAPKGLAVKENRHSPDAWEKGRNTSEKSLQHQRIKELKHEEVAQKAVERGKVAMKKAKLEKEMLEVQNELLEEIDFDLIGTGSQNALLGLDEEEEGDTDEALKVNQILSSDEFSEVDSDEEFSFPSPPRSTLTKFDVIHDRTKDSSTSALTLKPRVPSDNLVHGKVKGSSSSDSLESYSPPSLHAISSETSEDEKVPKRTSGHRLVPTDDKQNIPLNVESPDNTTIEKDKQVIAEMSPSAAMRDSTLSQKEKLSDDIYYDYEPDKADIVGTETNAKDLSKPFDAISPSQKQASKPSSKTRTAPAKQVEDTDDSDTSLGSYSPQSSTSEEKLVDKTKKKKKHASKTSTTDDKVDSKISESKELSRASERLSGRKKPERSRPKLEKKVGSVSLKHGANSEVDSISSNGRITKSITSDKHKSSSGSTIAEINVKTTSTADGITTDKNVSSLQDLHSRAKEQEILLRSSLTSATSSQEDDSRSEEKKVRNSMPVSKSASHHSKTVKDNKKVSRPKSQSLSSSSRTESDESSALLNLKIEHFDDSAPSQSSGSNVSEHKHSTSGESSALVNLKILEVTASTPSRSEKSGSERSRSDNSGNATTDYYSLPDGPFTSTPDGKLHPKGAQRSIDDEDHHLHLDNLKRNTLYHYMDKFLKRRPESIENLPVTTSSSSVIRADSDVVASESFADVTDETHSSYQSSQNSKKSLKTLYEGKILSDTGSTIAQAGIFAGRVVSGDTTTTSDSSARESEPSDTTKQSSGSSKDAEPVSSDSLTGLLRVLSNHQNIEKEQLDFDEIIFQQDLDRPIIMSGATRYSNVNQSSANADSSRDSIPDASAILRRIVSRASRQNASRASSSSSPKSGPERETKRVELLDDITPVGLLETPPRANQSGANDTQKLSAVFENLIDKWSNLKIEKPPWTPFPEHNE